MLKKPLSIIGRKPGSWDYKIEDYNKALETIFRHYVETEDPRDIILLIQLRNGSRIREAIRAFFKFAEENQREIYIPVEKQKKPDQRPMILPEDLKLSDVVEAVEKIKKKYKMKSQVNVKGKIIEREWETLRSAVSTYARRVYGVNTHSLRYSFVTHLTIDLGQSPTTVASITRHRNLNYVLHYTQSEMAERVLKDLTRKQK